MPARPVRLTKVRSAALDSVLLEPVAVEVPLPTTLVQFTSVGIVKFSESVKSAH